jgi:hypothetical protein
MSTSNTAKTRFTMPHPTAYLTAHPCALHLLEFLMWRQRDEAQTVCRLQYLDEVTALLALLGMALLALSAALKFRQTGRVI